MSRWLPFEDSRAQALDTEPVVSCHLGKIFHIIQARNAWWGSASRRYPGMKSFWPDVEHAKAEVERRRTQGSKWQINELPVLVLNGLESSLVIGEINGDEPLWKFLSPATDLVSLEESGRCFAPRRPDTITRIVCDLGAVPAAVRPFYRYRSIAHGGLHVPLWWGMYRHEDVALGRTEGLAQRLAKSLAAQPG